jgi:hypothetical protein
LCGWIASVGTALLQSQDLLHKGHHILAAAGGKSTYSQIHLQTIRSLCQSNNQIAKTYTQIALLLIGTKDIDKIIYKLKNEDRNKYWSVGVNVSIFARIVVHSWLVNFAFKNAQQKKPTFTKGSLICPC